jgi:hypothetical protein
MSDDIKLNVSRERHFSAHHMLLSAAYTAVNSLDKNKHGWFDNSLIAMTLSALAVEAMANAFGKRFVKGWEDFERVPPRAKLRLVCNALQLELNFGQEPWATVKWLLKFRNEIAHAKPEIIKTDHILSRDEYEKCQMEKPNAELEAQITVENAKLAYAAVDRLKDIWCARADPGETFGLYSDSWSGSATLANHK